MKYFFILPFFFSTLIYAQEETFETTHMTISGVQALNGNTSIKAPVKFLMYQDSLVVQQVHKGTIKRLKKSGMPTKVTFVSTRHTKETSMLKQYIYEKDNQRFTVQLKPSPSVKHQAKDDFSGQTTEILYVTVQ